MRASRRGVVVFQERYSAALRAHLGSAKRPRPGPADRLGARARGLGLRVTDLARIHHLALAAMPPGAGGARGRLRRALRAAAFLAEALAGHGTAGRSAAAEAAASRRLSRETERRKVAQDALGASERGQEILLERSSAMEEQLRQLSRSLLRSHEEERRLISRELHDTLGQALAGISLGLAGLEGVAAEAPRAIRTEVARTRRLVQASMETVHRFARDLHPTILDDLGLVPTLQSFARDFGRRSGIRVRLASAQEPPGLDSDRRTALFRVAQEALINVERHAGARNVRLTLRRRPRAVRLEVWNDGRPFDVARVQASRRHHRLGLLCMRERMEMVGGALAIQSSPEMGTTVLAEVPVAAPARG